MIYFFVFFFFFPKVKTLKPLPKVKLFQFVKLLFVVVPFFAYCWKFWAEACFPSIYSIALGSLYDQGRN